MLCKPRLAARFCHALLTFCCGRTLVANTGTTNITETTRFLTNHSQLQDYGFEMISTSLAPNRSGFTLIPSLMPSIPIFTVKAFGLQPSFCAFGVKVCRAFYELQSGLSSAFWYNLYLYIYIYLQLSQCFSLHPSFSHLRLCVRCLRERAVCATNSESCGRLFTRSTFWETKTVCFLILSLFLWIIAALLNHSLRQRQSPREESMHQVWQKSTIDLFQI